MRKMKEPCRAEDYNGKPKLTFISKNKLRLTLTKTNLVIGY